MRNYNDYFVQIVIEAKNGKTVKIETKGRGDADFTVMTTTQLPPDGAIPLSPPAYLLAIRVTFVEAVNKSVDYVIKIGISACFEVERE